MISRNAIHVKVFNFEGLEQSGKIHLNFIKEHETGKIRVEDCLVPGDKIRARIVRIIE